jgi:bifunctional non-homologous end joining protein LigD
VIQKHAARRLHYDLRLQIGDTLKSWAVTRGPSLHPGDRRLAVHVEDHPLAYGGFEGTIPKGEYGGGTVLLWDRGTWEPVGDAARDYRAGKLKFRLHGDKLQGGWMLVRMTPRSKRDRDNWLLIKERDPAARDAGDILAEQPDSVASGRSLDDIAGGDAPVWRSNRTGASTAPKPASVEFTAWTEDGLLRHPSFKGIREDKEAREVTRGASAKPAGKPGIKAGRATRQPPAATTPARTAPGTAGETTVAGVPISHPDRVLHLGQGLTKLGLAEYYAEVAPWMLPELAGRPLSLLRCPGDAKQGCFFQKHFKDGLLPALRQVPIAEKSGTKNYVAVDDVAGLVALVQFGVVEFHPWGARADDLERPDRVIFDLDPDPALDWAAVTRAATELRDRLAALRLRSFLKTTGGKGLHVVVPLTPAADWAAVKAFARAVAEAMVKDAPDRFVATMTKTRRAGKIFIDFFRNDRGATAVAAYSTRARPGAPIATPLAWEELTPALRSDHFTVANIARRLRALDADPWADMRKLKQRLPGAAPQARRAAGKPVKPRSRAS